MRYEPKPHHTMMTEFLLGHPRAALFAGCGLGKSGAVLNAVNTDYLDGLDRPTLIVAPLRVANLTWVNEVKKWDQFRWMKVENLRQRRGVPSGKAEIYTINYESLHLIKDLKFCGRVVFDELTKAKNPASLRIKAVRGHLKGTKHQRWGLTGTPRPNSLLELFAQVRTLDDGARLGPSFDHFRKAWFEPTDYMEYNWEPKPGSKEKIYEKIHDLALTLRSRDYTDVPDAVVEDIEVPLPKDAHAIYAELEKDLLAVLENGDEVVADSAGVLVNKLLQVTGGTIYATDAKEERTVNVVHGGKIAALQRLITTIDEPVIVACNYRHERARIVASIRGAVDAVSFKDDIEDAWNSGKIRCLVADPRSLGHGLNLQKGGRTIIWFSLTHSRELYDQFNARVDRSGQEDVPMIYRILCPGTIDDAVAESLREKGDGQAEMMRVLTNFRIQGKVFG